MFLWDGSVLRGTYVCHQERKEGRYTFWDLEYHSGGERADGETTRQWVIVRKGNYYTVLLDELKPLFGLRKTGTHLLQVGKKGRLMTISSVSAINNIPILTPSLASLSEEHDLRRDPTFRRKVQMILAFRELFGVSQTQEQNIFLHPDGPDVVPYSGNEITLVLQKRGDEAVLSPSLLRKWFGSPQDRRQDRKYDRTREDRREDRREDLSAELGILLRSMVCHPRIGGHQQFRSAVEKIIQRVAPECIWLSNLAYERLLRRISE